MAVVPNPREVEAAAKLVGAALVAQKQISETLETFASLYPGKAARIRRASRELCSILDEIELDDGMTIGDVRRMTERRSIERN